VDGPVPFGTHGGMGTQGLESFQPPKVAQCLPFNNEGFLALYPKYFADVAYQLRKREVLVS
jgi:hypothetical protein